LQLIPIKIQNFQSRKSEWLLKNTNSMK
jgi:hypothetical protein